MNVVCFRPEHLAELEIQPAQRALQSSLSVEYAHALMLNGECFSVLIDGKVVACVGVHEFHAGRAEGWALLAAQASSVLRPITRAVLGWIDQCPYGRLEANVATDFEAGHRWARMLGFQVEGPARRRYAPDGGDVVPYVRLR